LYVDDILIASRSRYAINKLKNNLPSEFEMKDLGEVKKMLGMEIERDQKVARLALRKRGIYKRYFTNSTSTVMRNL